MKRSLTLRGFYGVRALTAFLMMAGFFAAGAGSVAAQDGESGLDGNTYTSPNFDWSVEWDEDVWTFEEDSEDNAGGSDFFQLTTVSDEDPFAIATFFAGTGYNGDPDDCAVGYEDTLAGLDGNSDVEVTEDFELPETPDGVAAATYTYTATIDSGDLDLIDYVSCQTVVEDEAVLIFSITTTPNVFEDLIPIIDDLAAEITLPDAGSSSQDDEDVTPEADEDEDVTPEADDEEETPAADEEEETPESDEEDAEPTRDVLLGDDEEETPAADEEEETPAADEDEPQGDTGIDGTTYTSPTYGYAVEWDEDVWTADPDGELIDDGQDGLDRLRLTHQDGEDFLASFFVEGKVAYEGDTADCLEGEADLLSGEDAVVDFAPFEDENGDPVEGEADSGGEFAVFVATIETDDGDEVELIEHVECQVLEEGESVVIFTLLTSEELYEDELDAALDVIDTLELEGGGSANDDAAEDEDTSSPSADDEEAANEEPADEEPTEETEDEDDGPTFDGPADEDAEPTEEA